MSETSAGQPRPRDPVDAVRALVGPILGHRGLDLWDVTLGGGVLRVLVDAPDGVDLEALGEVTRLLSVALDETDPVPGRYTLEVSSPGLERTLRTPEHVARTIGERISLKTTPDTDGDRRCTGTLVAADDDGFTVRLDTGDPGGVDDRRFRYDQVESARTVFEWGPTPKPGGPGKKQAASASGSGGASTEHTTNPTKAATR